MYKVFATFVAVSCLAVSAPLMAQSPAIGQIPDVAQPSATENIVQPARSTSPGLVSGFALDFMNDQKAIWTSPFHISGGDVKWLAPTAVGAGTLAIFDHRISNAAKANPSLSGPSNAISNVGLIAPWAVPGTLFLVGSMKHDDHAAETGRLGLEAAVDSEVVMQVLKLATGRMRPNGSDTLSFPSGHSMEAFALAAVLSKEYHDKKWVVFGSYGLATAVGFARVGALEHFPTDVVAGAVIGELIGRYVVNHHAHLAEDAQ
jgi:membrane-associated phospholipid phosphatase